MADTCSPLLLAPSAKVEECARAAALSQPLNASKRSDSDEIEGHLIASWPLSGDQRCAINGLSRKRQRPVGRQDDAVTSRNDEQLPSQALIPAHLCAPPFAAARERRPLSPPTHAARRPPPARVSSSEATASRLLSARAAEGSPQLYSRAAGGAVPCVDASKPSLLTPQALAFDGKRAPSSRTFSVNLGQHFWLGGERVVLKAAARNTRGHATSMPVPPAEDARADGPGFAPAADGSAQGAFNGERSCGRKPLRRHDAAIRDVERYDDQAYSAAYRELRAVLGWDEVQATPAYDYMQPQPMPHYTHYAQTYAQPSYRMTPTSFYAAPGLMHRQYSSDNSYPHPEQYARLEFEYGTRLPDGYAAHHHGYSPQQQPQHHHQQQQPPQPQQQYQQQQKQQQQQQQMQMQQMQQQEQHQHQQQVQMQQMEQQEQHQHEQHYQQQQQQRDGSTPYVRMDGPLNPELHHPGMFRPYYAQQHRPGQYYYDY
ncbi:hypothetical protein T492DRAFT_1045378 [Pavlovales sp. CCMP2436]|nr:hypothetical protein T492DRAFT_1045378 [Pavlovales sp. CCMP2436]